MSDPVLNKNYEYETTDLALAGVLSLWFPLECVDTTNPRRATFVFQRNADLEKMIEVYWKKEARIEPQSYFSALRAIKSRLYENQRS